MTKLLKPIEVAERLAVSKRQVYYLMECGELPSIIIGKHRIRGLRVEEEALNEYIESRRRDDFKIVR